jgi:hypothetical protein
MAVSGSWARQNIYVAGPGKQGSGGYAIHGVRDEGPGRAYLADPADSLEDVPDVIIEPHDWGYDDGGMPHEPEAAMRSVGQRPGWDEKPDRSHTPGDYPKPGHVQASQEFHEVPHASQEEAMRAVAPFRGMVTGGWQAKITSHVNQSVTSPAQYERNTSMTQGMGVQEYANTRAVARGTDAPRSPIRSRSVGMVAKQYGKSWEMGGGVGTPRMFPFQQLMLRRPFFYRAPHLGPVPDAPYNVAESRVPLSYVEPALPDAGQPSTQTAADDWGYDTETSY